MNHICIFEGQVLRIYVEIYPMIVIRSLNTRLPHARDLRIDRTGKTGGEGYNRLCVTCSRHNQDRNPRAWILPFWSKTDMDSPKPMVGTKKVANDQKIILTS